MNFGELKREIQYNLGHATNANEDDFINFLQTKFNAEDEDKNYKRNARVIWAQFSNAAWRDSSQEIFGTEYEKWPAWVKEFKIKSIGKKFEYVTSADGHNYMRIDTNDEDAMDEAQKQFLKDFAKRYQSHHPDSKDELRASTCVTKKDPERAAKNQLKAICDNDKFYRRLKAFLRHGIVVHDILGTQFDTMNSKPFEKWLAHCCKIYAGPETLDVKEQKIQKAADILSI